MSIQKGDRLRTRGYADADADADAADADADTDGFRTKNNMSPTPWWGDIKTNKHKSNKRTESTKISSDVCSGLF